MSDTKRAVHITKSEEEITNSILAYNLVKFHNLNSMITSALENVEFISRYLNSITDTTNAAISLIERKFPDTGGYQKYSF